MNFLLRRHIANMNVRAQKVTLNNSTSLQWLKIINNIPDGKKQCEQTRVQNKILGIFNRGVNR